MEKSKLDGNLGADRVPVKSPRMKVFVIKDDKSSVYGLPIVFVNAPMFIRDIQDRIASKETIMARHPMDFTVFETGEFDPNTGVVESYDSKKCLGLVKDLMGPQQ